MTKVFIDGSSGTTGLQIRQRLAARSDLTIVTLPEAQRKDPAARADAMNGADVVFLCLPDAAAIEAAGFVKNPNTCVIDTSTAHRVDPDWVYGFAELGKADAIASAKRIANPGCHATGFISVVYPLVAGGFLKPDALLSCFSLTGYSGGGKSMIADYEAPARDRLLDSPGIYALPQAHKHIPEMVAVCGLQHAPVFCPIVDDYFKGMATTVPLHLECLHGVRTPEQLRAAYAQFYAGCALIHVASAEESAAYGKLYGNAKAGRDSLEIVVAGNDERCTVTAVFDNLGKGASGAAIQNMNLALGFEPTAGLVL